jgi:exosortase A-associated hydrolase 1
MTFREEVVPLVCGDAALLGILARPLQAAATGVVVLVGGPQYRVGSHRQFVLLSRALAEAGYAVLRFDVRGMGDSEGRPGDFQHTVDDISVAIQALQQAVPEVSRVVLWGLCDGASAALLYWHGTQDTRVTTLCLANPWVRSQTSLAHTHLQHYYLQRLGQADFWRKLLRGSIGPSALLGLARTLRMAVMGQNKNQSAMASFQERMAWAWARFPGRIVLLLSQHDFTAKEFLHHATHDSAWKNSLSHPRLVRHEQAGADHTFSSAAQCAELAAQTLRHGLDHPVKPGA